MSENEINVAIAEACGWTHTKTINNPNETAYGRHPVHTADVTWELPLPNYCGDLNAMHEAEKVLDQIQARAYGDNLANSEQDGTWAGCHMWHHTAFQRAEAFLRALGKWSE